MQQATQTERYKPPVESRIWPRDYSTDQIKMELAEFEKYYNEACKGEKVHNDILGNTFQGVVDYAVEFGAIIDKSGYWFIKESGWKYWDRKYRGMCELRSRRAYAKMMEAKHYDEEAQKISPPPIEEPKLENNKIKTEDDLEWEERNGMRIEDLPF